MQHSSNMHVRHAVTYYSAIIAWAAYYFGASFVSPFPWAAEECGEDALCAADPDRALPLPSSDSYFRDTVLQLNDSSLEDGVARIFSGPLVGCALPRRASRKSSHYHRIPAGPTATAGDRSPFGEPGPDPVHPGAQPHTSGPAARHSIAAPHAGSLWEPELLARCSPDSHLHAGTQCTAQHCLVVSMNCWRSTSEY